MSEILTGVTFYSPDETHCDLFLTWQLSKISSIELENSKTL